MRRALPLALVALASGAALAGDRSHDPFEGRTAGTPVDCIALSNSVSPVIVDANTITYRQSGKRLWRTGPVGQCTALHPTDTLVVEVFGGQLCRNDRFRVLSPGRSIPSGSCRFTAFVPYDKP